MTIPPESDKIPSAYSEEEDQYPSWHCQENPWLVKRGERQTANTPWSWHPNGFFQSPVGVLRERPLPRGSVLALHEAVFREGTANQRWYRESISPSVPAGTGAFYSVSVNFYV